MATLTT